MEWVLILFVHASVLSSGDSVALTNVAGFKTEQACRESGEKARNLVKGTFKDAKFVCVAK